MSVENFLRLGNVTTWRKVAEVVIPFETHHPQGIFKRGDDYFLTTVSKEYRKGWLQKFRVPKLDRVELVAEVDITAGENGREYHPGGLDLHRPSGKLWIPMAEYARRTSTTIISFDMDTSEKKEILKFGDHVGSIICDTDAGFLRMTNWDTEGVHSVELDAKGMPHVDQKKHMYERHPNFFQNPIFDRFGRFGYQDSKSLEPGYALCGGCRRGLFWQIGCLDLIRFDEKSPGSFGLVKRIWTPGVANDFSRDWFNIPLSRNPFHYEVIEDGFRFYFMPHDGPHSILYIFEARARKKRRRRR